LSQSGNTNAAELAIQVAIRSDLAQFDTTSPPPHHPVIPVVNNFKGVIPTVIKSGSDRVARYDHAK